MKSGIPDEPGKGHQQCHGDNNKCGMNVFPEFVFYSHKQWQLESLIKPLSW
jgi:hypothetical protein